MDENKVPAQFYAPFCDSPIGGLRTRKKTEEPQNINQLKLWNRKKTELRKHGISVGLEHLGRDYITCQLKNVNSNIESLSKFEDARTKFFVDDNRILIKFDKSTPVKMVTHRKIDFIALFLLITNLVLFATIIEVFRYYSHYMN